MEGSPAQLISNFPLIGSSLQRSWELLTTRYENKRLLIQAQLDKLCHLTRLTSKSARGLTTLISTVSEASKALESLGVTQELGDHMLTYHVSRYLDRSTRKAWKTSLGSSSEYPKVTPLESFINARACALERIESSALTTQTEKSTLQKTQSSRKSVTAHQASASEGSSQQRSGTSHSTEFQCDCCEGNHFIVVCPCFRDLDIPARRKLIELKRLSYNCMGRHSAHSFKSTRNCKHCSRRHHTMLHPSDQRTTQPAKSSKPQPEPRPTTSSAPH